MDLRDVPVCFPNEMDNGGYVLIDIVIQTPGLAGSVAGARAAHVRQPDGIARFAERKGEGPRLINVEGAGVPGEAMREEDGDRGCFGVGGGGRNARFVLF